MPEAAVREDDRAPCRKHQIGPPREVPAVKTEPETERMQTPAQEHLRLCVFAADAAHVELPLDWREHVHHGWDQAANLPATTA
jgi:hypothetical protein